MIAVIGYKAGNLTIGVGDGQLTAPLVGDLVTELVPDFFDCPDQIVRAASIRASAGRPMAVVSALIGYCSSPAFTTNCLSDLRSLQAM